MSEYASILAMLAAGHLLAVLSPGPNNALVVQMSGYGRKAAFLLAAGIFPAGLFWATLGMAGVGQVLRAIPTFEIALRVIGGLYLLWIGVKIFRESLAGDRDGNQLKPVPSSRHLLLTGFLTNFTNPKSIAWYTSIFAATGAFSLPAPLQVAAVIGLPMISASWHIIFGIMLTSGPARAGFARIRKWIDRFTAVVLVAFGLRLLISG